MYKNSIAYIKKILLMYSYEGSVIFGGIYEDH